MASNIRRGNVCIGVISLAAVLLGVLAPREGVGSHVSLLAAAGLLAVALITQLTEKPPQGTDVTYSVPILVAVALAAGLISLPSLLLTPLIALAALPVMRRGIWHWLAATAPAAFAAHIVAVYAHTNNFSAPIDLLDGVILLGGALVFLTIYEGLRAIEWFATGFSAPIRSPMLFAPVFTDALYAVLAVAGVGVWFAVPAVLVLAFPALLLVQHLGDTHHYAALADTDPKTGLPNVRFFEREATTALTQDAAKGLPTSVLFLDLDYFKSVNDLHGHAAGDQVLREAGNIFALALRRRDLVARFGGEEFVALLPATDADTVMRVAEEVRAAIAAHAFLLPDGMTMHCTASIGTTTAPADGTDLATLLAQADRAMYAAKATRNAVRQAHVLAEQFRPIVISSAPSAAVPPLLTRPWTAILAPTVQWLTIFSGGVVTCVSIVHVTTAGEWKLFPLFAAATVIAWLFPITIYRADGETHSFAFTLAVGMAVITVQPWLAPLVHIVGMAAHLVQRKQRQWDKALFNLANSSLAAAIAAMVFTFLRPAGDGFTLMHVIAALASAFAYCAINITTVALMVSLYGKRPLPDVLRQAWVLVPVELLLGTIGAFIGTVYAVVGGVGVALFALPLVLMHVVLSMSTRKNQDAIAALEAAKAHVEAAKAAQEMTLAHLITMLSSIIDARDQQIAGHSQNVARYATIIAAELGLSPEEITRVHMAGLLHDLGKVAVSETILHKPAKLSDDEYAAVKEHAIVGRRILADTPLLGPVAVMVGDHHERWAGGGYPHGTRGEAISIGGRIIAVADALDSIVANRVYSRGKPLTWALNEIAQCAGEQFDPSVVAALEHAVAVQGADAFLAAPPVTVLTPLMPPAAFGPAQPIRSNS